MTITKLELENFKCFERLSTPLAPLTLLTGFNAGGKSTLLQVLLLLSQAIHNESSSAKQILLNGPLVRLGTAGEILFSNAQQRLICFQIESDGEYMRWELSLAGSNRRSLSIETATFQANRKKNHPGLGISHKLPRPCAV
jgi:predicted ATPase